MNKIKTAEYVSAGHPDKVCDQISDAILDEYLRQDPQSRVAVETMGGHGEIYITGEVTSTGMVDAAAIAAQVYSEIGYTDIMKVHTNIVHQSTEIAQGVDSGGAGDQGIMVGYACSDNDAMLPQELFLAREIIQNLPSDFGPDAKSQVTLNENGDVGTIVISAQHKPGQDFAPLYDLAKKYNPKNIFINPTGDFSIGGFAADTGLTGRKLAVDNYGPQIPLGGGCYSGKDATKVDRSAAYMARRIAVDYLQKLNANEVLVKLAYSIGVAEPVMAVAIVSSGASTELVIDLLQTKEYDLTPKGIITFLDLKRPIFKETARSGHYGNNMTWDALTKL